MKYTLCFLCLCLSCTVCLFIPLTSSPNSRTRCCTRQWKLKRKLPVSRLSALPVLKWTRMWANAQRDGRPAEYRWHPLFNAAKFGWCPILECRAVTLPRPESRWNLQGYPKLATRFQPLVGRSSPLLWRHVEEVSMFNIFFRLSIHASAAKIQPDNVVRWCQYGDFFASCIFSESRAAHFRHAF